MIYGVSFSESLVDALAHHLWEKHKENPIQLAQTCIILPTKRACLELKKAFNRLANQNNLLLPKLMSIYDLDLPVLDIPPAISSLERTLLLAKLCLPKPNILDYHQALKMAISLGELLDFAYQFELDLSQIHQLVTTDQFATHWQETVQFLDILHTYWPKILAEQHKIDPMDRSVRLIRALTQQLKHSNTPVVIAGVGPQFPALSELLEVLQHRENTLILKDNEIIQSETPLFTQLYYPQEKAVIEAFGKDFWQDTHLPQNTFDNVQIINAATVAEEALTIALILREALETPHQTAALVTTDRNLSRQVITQMKRWNIQLDDSAGTPLNHTEVGIFFQLIANLGEDPSESNYLALLKHPLSADGIKPTSFRHKIQDKEFELRKSNLSWQMDLNTDFEDWINLFKNNNLTSFSEILRQHITVAESLAKSSDRTSAQRLWQTDTGKILFQLLSDLLVHAHLIGSIEPAVYPALIKLLIQQIPVRPKYGMHPRLDILGPIEARFHHPDVCIIGGLNDGIFPPFPEIGPWLNRPMRQQLNLPQPEDRINELAMDFAHNFCARKVYLTRALKVDGTQAVPSRFLERLKAVAQINHLSIPECQSHLAKLIDTPSVFDDIKRPAPCPPVQVRPQRLPVTQIETWRRNPYAIYAKYILKLFPLNKHNRNAIFGTLIHEVIQEFLEQDAHSVDKTMLLHIAKCKFEQSNLTPVDKILLNIKFSAIADFIIEQQKMDLGIVKKTACEEKISCTLHVNDQPFELYGVADRIDMLKDNTLRIIDYKTYTPPKQKEVVAGYAPQLPLEALILNEIRPQKVSTLAYWYLSNKKENSCVYPIVTSTKETHELVEKTKQGLMQMIMAFQSDKTPYEVCPIPSQAPQFNDYQHLARMQEWAFLSGDET